MTRELLRRKAEHNDGMLSTLEEISLHQLSITKIENIDALCKHLKILYLQNNLISKMENMHKLKELEYLNMAVNNVAKIEGIKTCESLYKLDLTLNFVDLDTFKESIEHLAQCENIKELVLIGNPCTDWPDYADYVIAKIDTLCRMDSTDITKSMKIVAIQKLDQLEKDLEEKAEEVRYKKANSEPDYKGYTAESRMKEYQDDLEKKRQDVLNKPKNPFEVDADYLHKRTGPPSIHYTSGEVRQCNEGKYRFKITEENDND
jgi:protein TilB